METETSNAVGTAGPSAWSDLGNTETLLDIVSDRVFAFDGRMRIVCSNAAFGSAFGSGNEPFVGRSLGEVLGCRHVVNHAACGGSAGCHVCGWFLAAKSAQQGKSDAQECRILSDSGRAYDFFVRAVPAKLAGGGLCSLTDLYASKRLRVLERSFFHDVTNLAVGIRGLTEMLDLADVVQTEEYVRLLHDSSEKMVDEILRLRTLRVAENGDLVPCCGRVSATELLKTIVARQSEEASARHVDVGIECPSELFVDTDRELAHLVLSCLVLNAIEASKRGDRVTVGFSVESDAVVFWVGNGQVLAEEVGLQMFERSFTTKGAGKGVGAYGAKLIAERFLKGQVWFVSRECEGTVFYVKLPLSATG